jgi:hypothetical protein
LLLSVPFRGRSVDAVPPEFFDDKPPLGREQADDLVESRFQALDVVERVARDRCVVRSGLVEGFESRAAEDRPLGGFWVNREDPEAVAFERAREVAGAAAHLKHPRWQGRKRSAYEGNEIQRPRESAIPSSTPASAPTTKCCHRSKASLVLGRC